MPLRVYFLLYDSSVEEQVAISYSHPLFYTPRFPVSLCTCGISLSHATQALIPTKWTHAMVTFIQLKPQLATDTIDIMYFTAALPTVFTSFQKYLTSLRKEKEAFQQLIKERAVSN